MKIVTHSKLFGRKMYDQTTGSYEHGQNVKIV